MDKKIILTCAALSLLAVGKASADQKMVVTDTSTSTVLESFSLGDISKLSFAEGKMTVTMNDESTQDVSLSTSLMLQFEDVATAISQVDAAKGKLQVAYDGENVSFAGLGGVADAAVYTMGGQKVLSLKAWNGKPVSMASLGRGVYIIKVNNQSFKFVKK